MKITFLDLRWAPCVHEVLNCNGNRRCNQFKTIPKLEELGRLGRILLSTSRGESRGLQSTCTRMPRISHHAADMTLRYPVEVELAEMSMRGRSSGSSRAAQEPHLAGAHRMSMWSIFFLLA